MPEEIPERLARIRERAARAAERSGRGPEDIRLIAVSKTVDSSLVQIAVDNGVRDLGENRVQEAIGKVQKVKADGLRWHLIGHLQSNKARQAVLAVDVIHTVDTVDLARRLDRISAEEGKRPIVLVQVDLAHEPTKSGADEAKLREIVEALDLAENLDFRGLMTMPPFADEPEPSRDYFRRLREILEKLNVGRPRESLLTELSMGMSHDFEIAIEEGATMIRVGTAIFGPREKRP
jgi:pyridoxal phosphate enzyme (YggS family)